jgi:hypothetical protein
VELLATEARFGEEDDEAGKERQRAAKSLDWIVIPPLSNCDSIPGVPL